MPGRDGKNINSTRKIKRGQETAKSEILDEGKHLFQIYHRRGSKSFHLLGEEGQKNLSSSERGVPNYYSVILNSTIPILLGYR